MSCEQCERAAAAGARVCASCGQDLEQWARPGDDVAAPATTDSPSVSAAPGEPSHVPRVLAFVGGFFLALLLMGIGAAAGGSVAGVPGAFGGAAAAPLAMILIARANGLRPLAAGAITAVAIVVIVFGGCLMMLSGTSFH
jgi:hypothetical protein